jgi:hypothetical protein
VVELVQLIALAAEQVQVIALAVELEEIDRVVARGSVLVGETERAPCRLRDHLVAARIALAIKTSAVAPGPAAGDSAGAAEAVPISVPAAAASAAAGVVAPLAQVVIGADIAWAAAG